MKAKNDLDLSELLGQELTQETFSKLLAEGFLQFPDRPVGSPSAVSSGTQEDGCQIGVDGIDNSTPDRNKKLNDLINNIKENEELVKTLEDMRDDLLKNMKIPTNGSVADAAKTLGSSDGAIDKETFDKAEIITSPDFVAISTMGFLPKLSPLVGDARIFGDYSKCSDVTNAIFDSFKLANDSEFAATFDPNKYSTSDTINDTNEQYEKKMGEIFLFLINKFFWNYIWTRMWGGIFNFVEKVIAKPIDTPIIILSQLFRFKINEDDYYKKGPVHKLLNKAKLNIFCRIPRNAFEEYQPEDNIRVYDEDNGILTYVSALCSSAKAQTYQTCTEAYEDTINVNSTGNGDETQNIDDMQSGMAAVFSKFTKPAPEKNTKEAEEELQKCFDSAGLTDKNAGTAGVNAECLAAATKVIQAAYNDALNNNKTQG